MTPLLLFIFALALAATAAMYVALRGHHRGIARIEDMEGNTSPVNLQCFARLTDAKDQAFLRSTLPPKVYRRVQRERVLIAIEYVKIAARNAAILIRVGEMQASDVSSDVHARAKKLIEESFQLRLVCLLAIIMLSISFIFPEQNISILDLISKYESMSDSLGLLTMQSDPLLASRVRTWL